MLGTQIGSYRIIEKLGEGGMGVVYKAVDTLLDRPVAIKMLPSELSRDASLIQRFQAEARAQAHLSHTNIATLYTLLAHEGNYFMVMEHVEGETFGQMVERRGPIPAPEIIPLFKQALLGLGYAHRQGIIHRDIKPGNIMVNRSRIVKVMDFGIARILGGKHLTRTGTQVGTVYYMSPEQIQNKPVDIRSDIYALGVTLYEMVSGRVPFNGESDFEIMSSHVNVQPSPPSHFYPYLPKSLEQAILKALEKNPENRFQTVEQFGAALEVPQIQMRAATRANQAPRECLPLDRSVSPPAISKPSSTPTPALRPLQAQDLESGVVPERGFEAIAARSTEPAPASTLYTAPQMQWSPKRVVSLALYIMVVVGVAAIALRLYDDWKTKKLETQRIRKVTQVRKDKDSPTALNYPITLEMVKTCSTASARNNYTPQSHFSRGDSIWVYAEASHDFKRSVNVDLDFSILSPEGTEYRRKRLHRSSRDWDGAAWVYFTLPPGANLGTYAAKVEMRDQIAGQSSSGSTFFTVVDQRAPPIDVGSTNVQNLGEITGPPVPHPGGGIYTVGEGVRPPIPIFQPLPLYTEEARKARIEGYVQLQAVVRKDGTVHIVKVIRGLGYGLDESAINTIATKWRFQPATLNGVPVDKQQANIEVHFRLY